MEIVSFCVVDAIKSIDKHSCVRLIVKSTESTYQVIVLKKYKLRQLRCKFEGIDSIKLFSCNYVSRLFSF